MSKNVLGSSFTGMNLMSAPTIKEIQPRKMDQPHCSAVRGDVLVKSAPNSTIKAWAPTLKMDTSQNMGFVWMFLKGLTSSKILRAVYSLKIWHQMKTLKIMVTG